jgi:hypothetical protein
MKRRLIKKNQKNSRIEDSRTARSRIDLAYVTKNICSKIAIIWSRKFVWLNENRTKKSKRKSTKFLESNSKFRIAVKYVKKKVRKWLEKEKKIENDFDDESRSMIEKFFNDEVILNVSFAETFAKRKTLYKLINCWTLNSEIDIHVCNDSKRFQLNRMIDFEN